MSKKSLSLLSLAIATIIVTAGCETSENSAVAWNTSTASVDNSSSSNNQGNNTTPTTGSSSASDQVAFSSLNWVYGGFDGSGASHDKVSIKNLKMNSSGLSYAYSTNLSAWGISFDDCNGALICMFVKNNKGQWVGGKIDWISSSRVTRDYHNVYGHYNGWTLSDVPNPTDACIVIVHKDGKRRSNVISTTWAR